MFLYYIISSGLILSLSPVAVDGFKESDGIGLIRLPGNSRKVLLLRETPYERMAVVNNVLLVDGVPFFTFNEVKAYLQSRLNAMDYEVFRQKDQVFANYLACLIEQEREGVLTFPINTFHYNTGAAVTIANTTQLHNTYRTVLSISRGNLETYIEKFATAKRALETATTLEQLMTIEL